MVWASKTITKEDLEKINNVKNLDIVQKTPLRVLHRRTLMNRNKHIFTLHAKKINDNFTKSILNLHPLSPNKSPSSK